MSINVTVTGNPVSIKRGKMITSDPNYEKHEFEKRRLIRLEQVRQQAKDIAEDVRNKVRNEKTKQLKLVEKEGRDKLKSWQNRKLLELQNQYKEVLQEIGSGHKEAEELADEIELLADQEKQNHEISKQRGLVAATKLQVEKNEKNLKKSIPIQRKKLTREVENTRASMVTGLKKVNRKTGSPSKKRKKTSADINITIPESESQSSDISYEETPVTDRNTVIERSADSSCDCNGSSNGPRIPLNLNSEDSEKGFELPITERYKTPTDKDRSIPSAVPVTSCYSNQKTRDRSPPADTRISDRIKRRDVMASQVDYCDMVAETNPIPLMENNKNIRNAVDSRYQSRSEYYPNREYMASSQSGCFCGGRKSRVNFHDEVKRDEFREKYYCPCGNRGYEQFGGTQEPQRLRKDDPNPYNPNRLTQSSKMSYSNLNPYEQLHSRRHLYNKSTDDVPQFDQRRRNLSQTEDQQNIKSKLFQDIPVKPPIRVKDVEDKSVQASTKTSLAIGDSNRVMQYDHQNRFSNVRRVPSGSVVERITADSLEVVPNLTSEIEWYQKMQQRDKEAQIRGQKALEKEKIQRDYAQLMKKLPILQKKERICEISNDKPEYHMSEERLKEKEKQKQNRMDNAYNDLFPNLKPAVVTLPKVNTRPKSPEKPEPEPVQSINVAEWDVDYKEPKMFTADEVQEIVDSYVCQDPKLRQEKLRDLLRSLKLQKEQLVEEMKRLPVNESVNELINDLNSFNEGDKKSRKKQKADSKRKRHESDFDSTTSSTSSISEKISDVRRQRHTHASKKSASPRKKAKMKLRKKVLILQNTSTQTTPKMERGTAQKDNEPEKTNVKICEKLHVPCDCNKENEKSSSEEVCHIFINLNEDETPDVLVKSKEQTAKSSKTPEHSPKKSSYKSVAVGPDETDRMTPRKLSLKHISKDILEKAKTESSKFTKLCNKEKQSKKSPSATTNSKSKSWREQLTKNSISTSSTSYWSPPDFEKSKEAHSSTKNLSSFYNLRKKPHQKSLLHTLLSDSEDSLGRRGMEDAQLLAYVKKLLNMSRHSIEQLNVSSVSTVPTPSQSIVEVETNNPSAELEKLVKFFNKNKADLAKELSYSSDHSAPHYNTSASASDKEADEKSAVTIGTNNMIPERDSSTSHKSKESVLAQYTDVTDSCSKRIAALAEMIQRIRDEKIHMLQNPPVVLNGDYSTSYMDLPESKESSKQSSVSSLDEEEICRRLHEIDHSLAARLKKHPSGNKYEEVNKAEAFNDINEELLARLQLLKNVDSPPAPPPLVESTESVFVPFLTDIPKLPKFEPQLNRLSNTGNNHRKPPPSKGLSVVKKFNEDITLIPHELSTIAEADSQISTKIGSALPSPSSSRTTKAFETKDIDLIIIPEVKQAVEICDYNTCKAKTAVGPKSPSVNQESLNCDDSTCNNNSSNKSSKLMSSTSAEDIGDIEAMLKSIGMAWAIPTLYKTQEALALTSSSSSLDLNSKKVLGNESSGSEVSLRDFLKKQMWCKISSSTCNSDASPASLLGEIADLSEINAVDKDKQRTSTPITNSKSTNKSRDAVFSGVSDLSSVRTDSPSHSNSK